MSEGDNRHIARDSLFILAELRVDGQTGEQRVKVRNLSSGGLMAEGDLRVSRDQKIWVKLRNLGWVEGLVAWVQDNRFGVAFSQDIDPKLARAPANTESDDDAAYTARRYAAPIQAPTGPLRKLF